jgi:hypothetical protein
MQKNPRLFLLLFLYKKYYMYIITAYGRTFMYPIFIYWYSSSKFSKASVQGWGFIPYGPNGNSDKVVAALSKYGPCQIGIDASCLSGYSSGVIKNCTSANTDHAVTIVGADTDASGTDYFIVKNSWNTTFGESGYFRVARNTPTPQMGISGAYCGCFDKYCRVNQ